MAWRWTADAMSGLATRTLLKPEPENARTHAMNLLRERQIMASRVVAVAPSYVTYLDQKGCPWTAWLLYLEDRQKCVMTTEPGMPAFPSTFPA